MGIEHSKNSDAKRLHRARGSISPNRFDFRPGQAFEIQLPGAVPGESGARSDVTHSPSSARRTRVNWCLPRV